MTDDQRAIDDIRNHVGKLQYIINGLEGNDAYAKLVEILREQVLALDETWHLIPLDNTKQIMEARSAKMAYAHMINWIEFAKADVERGLKTIKEAEDKEEE